MMVMEIPYEVYHLHRVKMPDKALAWGLQYLHKQSSVLSHRTLVGAGVRFEDLALCYEFDLTR